MSSQLLSKIDEKSSISQPREPVQIPLDLFQRLIKFKIIDEIERPEKAQLTILETDMFYNAQIFMRYLLVLRRLMVSLSRYFTKFSENESKLRPQYQSRKGKATL